MNRTCLKYCQFGAVHNTAYDHHTLDLGERTLLEATNLACIGQLTYHGDVDNCLEPLGQKIERTYIRVSAISANSNAMENIV